MRNLATGWPSPGSETVLQTSRSCSSRTFPNYYTTITLQHILKGVVLLYLSLDETVLYKNLRMRVQNESGPIPRTALLSRSTNNILFIQFQARSPKVCSVDLQCRFVPRAHRVPVVSSELRVVLLVHPPMTTIVKSPTPALWCSVFGRNVGL